MKYFPLLAACEIAGAVALVLGIWWLPLGVAAGIGLLLYFLVAVLSHLRVEDVKGIGPAAFLLALSAGELYLRLLKHAMPLELAISHTITLKILFRDEVGSDRFSLAF